MESAKSENTRNSQSSPSPGKEQPEAGYPSRLSLSLIALGLCLAVFCFALDQTIVANAIPRITDEFDSVADIGWYGSSFLLATSAFQLFYGTAYSYFSIKSTFLIATGLFELGSLLCAVAPSSTAFIIGRAVAGLGGSGIMGGALVIIAHSVPLRRRPLFIGAIGAMFGIASVCGPLLGGVFTDRLTWRWCFYINLPFGAITVIAVALFFKPPRRPAVDSLPFLTKMKKLDWLGMFFFVPSIVSLLLALQWGGSTYPWDSGRIIALFVVFAVLGFAFGFVEYKRKDQAILPPSIITQRSIAAAAWYSFFNGAAFLVVIYYTPLWHQVVRQVSAVESGIRLLPMIVGNVVMVMISGCLVTVIGYYAPFMLVSTILTPISEGLLSTWTVDATFSQWFGYEAFAGIAFGAGMQQPVMAVQTVLPIDQIPIGTSLVVFMQTLGAAVFVSVAQSVFSNQLIADLKQFAGLGGGGFNPTDFLSAGATNVFNKIPPQLVRPFLDAFNHAVTRVYIISICCSSLTLIGSLAMEYKSVKNGKKKEETAA
ncbi:major facilitator superfamily domain-containing protein [Echria macrotheca]|uniref:Major facilitator superfamily domain-containing protein n=1 Tax=Echria macrotheca TaxID=438768 RepID=A0AAJ0B7X7_9PEZI|nr:major facilitator superfamily domain-containing protein [Echria macrotheca]